jgi:hypothetical protein
MLSQGAPVLLLLSIFKPMPLVDFTYWLVFVLYYLQK